MTIALLISTFLSAIEVTIVSTAMPVIGRDLGGLHLISWVYAAYLLPSAVMAPIFGKLADLFGRKKIFMISISLFLVGSMLCGISQTMQQLVIFRLIQGVGAGGLLPLSQTIIGDIYQFEQRAKVQGWISSIWGIAGLLGPLLGGFLVEYLSWHWIFFINLPFGLVAMAMIGKFLHQEVEYRKHQIDYGGAITFILGMGILLFILLTGGDTLAWHSPYVIAALIVSGLLLTLFIIIQLKHPEPLVPIKLFRKREVAISNVSSFLGSAVLIGLNAYLPLWIQGVLQLKATASGLTLSPISLGWLTGAFLTGQFLTKLGTRWIAISGVLCIFGGTLLLNTITLSTSYLLLIGIMFLIGIGFGLSFTIYTVVIQSSVETSVRGAATSSNTFLRVLGQTMGISLLGAVFNQVLGTGPEVLSPSALAEGLYMVYLILAGVALLNLVITLRIPVFVPKQEREKR